MEMFLHEMEIDGALNKIHLSEPKIFVDNEKRGRSGHVGHALIEIEPGKILAFNANTSNKRASGHAAFGWMEYRISEDYGKTWGEIIDFPYSKKEFYDGVHTVSVEKAVVCDDGTIIAFCLINTTDAVCSCEPWDIPKYVISKDGGKSWSEAEDLCEYKGRIYDAIYYNGSVYVLEFCNDAKEHFCGNKDEHLYRLFKSDDNGKSFYEESVVDFPTTKSRGYGNMIFTPEGKLMVYAYNVEDEQSMDCVISEDLGKSWGNYTKCFVKNRKTNDNGQIRHTFR